MSQAQPEREYACTIVVTVLASGEAGARAKLDRQVPVSHRVVSIEPAAQQPGQAAARDSMHVDRG